MQRFDIFKELRNIHMSEVFEKGEMEQDVVGNETGPKSIGLFQPS